MGSLLHSLGANVVKVEQPRSGDPARDVSPWGFLNYNLGKRSISLNLKSRKGREIIYRLIRKTDIFLENLGPNVPRRLGISYSILRRLNRRLIYCSIKGFSSGSPHYGKPAFDAVAQAMSGMMSLTGEPGGEPLRVGNPAVDLGAAAYGAIEILSAVLERQKSGHGKFIEISLLDMSVYWNGYWLTYYGITGTLPERLGSGHPGYCPHKVFETQDGRYLLIATLNDTHWKRLSKILEISLGIAYDDMKYRLAHRTLVEQAVADAVLKRESGKLLMELGKVVPCAPVRSIAEVYNDEELKRRGVLRDIRYDSMKVRIATPPIAREGKKKDFSPPNIGHDTENILKMLGYKSKDIRKFKDAGII